MRLRFTPAVGDTVEEIQENARKSDLAKSGNMALVWMNAKDLALLANLNGMMDAAITSDADVSKLQPRETPIPEADMSDLYEN